MDLRKVYQLVLDGIDIPEIKLYCEDIWNEYLSSYEVFERVYKNTANFFTSENEYAKHIISSVKDNVMNNKMYIS